MNYPELPHFASFFTAYSGHLCDERFGHPPFVRSRADVTRNLQTKRVTRDVGTDGLTGPFDTTDLSDWKLRGAVCSEPHAASQEVRLAD